MATDRGAEARDTEPSAAADRYRRTERRWWDSVNLAPSERRVHLPRFDVGVRLQEVGHGQPLLFVHGGPSAGAEWIPMLPGLVDGFRCLVLDRPGTGLSEPLDRSVAVEELGDHLIASVLDGLGLDRAHLVVSSLGGYMAIRTAVVHPDLVGRTVQMGCPGAVPGMRVPPFMRLVALPFVGRLLARLPPSERSTEWQLRQIGHGASLDAGAFSDELLAWALSYARDTDTMANDQALIGEVMTVRGLDPSFTIAEDVLRAVESPSYFLWGEDDPFGGEDVARRTVRMLPNAELEMVPDAGHLPWLDVPERATRATRDFLLA